LKRGCEYLVREQAGDGLIGRPVSDGLYNHAPALMALMLCRSEAGGAILDSAVRKGLSALLARQKEDGGFGYSDGLSGNSVISLWPLEALLLARKSGYSGMDQPIARASAFLDACQVDGAQRYTPGSRAPATPVLLAQGAYRAFLSSGIATTQPASGIREAMALSFVARSGSAEALDEIIHATRRGNGVGFGGGYSRVTRDDVAAAALTVLAAHAVRN
jgi:hypothetical protein